MARRIKWTPISVTAATFIISGIATLYLGYYYLPAINDDTKKLVNLLGVLLSLSTGAIVSLLLAMLTRNEQVDARFDDISYEIRSCILERNSFTYVGGTEDALKYIDEHIPVLRQIYNTRVSTSFVARDTSADRTHRKEIVDLIKKCVDQGEIRWSEVFSEQGASRAEEIMKTIKRKDDYTPYKLKTNFPIPNFTHLTFKDAARDPEVLFGFWFHEHDERIQVFSSNHPHLVRNFEDFYRTLRDIYSKRVDTPTV